MGEMAAVAAWLESADGLDDDEVATLSTNLLFAGHETTVVAIDMGVLCLLANPAERRALADDPDQITPTGPQRPLSARAAWVAGPRLVLGPRRFGPRLCALLADRRRCSRR